MRRLRILHLVSCRGWSSDAYWAARMAVELEQAGHEVTLCCRAGSEAQVIQRARDLGARRVETLGLEGGLRPRGDLRDLQRLSDWLPEFDLLHVHRGKEHWLGALANRLSGCRIPLVRTRHIVQAVRPHALNRWLYRAATDLVVTVTEAIRRQYVASGLLPPERVVTLPGGVDAERFRPGLDAGGARGALDVPEGTPLVGFVSGLRAMKGHRVVLEAASILARDGVRPRFVFIGEGPLRETLREAIRRSGLDAEVTLAGFVPDLPAAMAALDVALYVPLESDGMSRVVFESLALGLPVVASRVGVIPEVLADGRDALLVPAGDPRMLAQAIRRLLEEPGLRACLGAAGRQLVVERFSGVRVAARLAELYSRMLDRRPA